MRRAKFNTFSPLVSRIVISYPFSLSILSLAFTSYFLFFLFNLLFILCNCSLHTGIIDSHYSPFFYQTISCATFYSGCGVSYPYTTFQVLIFLDFFTADESAVLSTFRFFPFAFFPSDCNSVVDGDIGVSTIFPCFLLAFGGIVS